MKDNLLEVGDVLFDTDRWSGIQRYVIDKVTAKQAFSGNCKFVRELQVSKNMIANSEKFIANWIGKYGSADIATEEWEEEYELQALRRKARLALEKVNAALLNKEQCLSVINLLSPLKDLSKN